MSQAFVLREIIALRARGFDLHVMSIRSPDRPPERLTRAERLEAVRSYYVIDRGWLGAIAAHLGTLRRRPGAYVAGLWLALDVAHLNLRRSMRRILYFIEAVVVGEHMRRLGLSHLHTHFCSHVAVLVRRIFPVTYSATIHGPLPFENSAWSSFGERVGAAEFICVTSQHTRVQLMLECPHAMWHRLEPLVLGVEPDVFRADGNSSPRSAIRMLCVARLAPAKGHVLLLSAFERLCATQPAVELHLVGDGPLRESLVADVTARGLADRVIFHGARNQDEVLQAYRDADVFVLASLAEGMPVSLMEAMSMGIPCIAPSVCGIPELIRDGIDGLLVRPGDPTSLAGAMHRVVASSELRRRLGEAGRARILSAHDLSHSVDQLADRFLALPNVRRPA